MPLRTCVRSGSVLLLLLIHVIAIDGICQLEVVRLELVVPELVPPLARRRRAVALAAELLVHAGRLGVVGGLPRRPHEPAVGHRRRPRYGPMGAAPLLIACLRLQMDDGVGSYPPTLPPLPMHRCSISLAWVGSVWFGLV